MLFVQVIQTVGPGKGLFCTVHPAKSPKTMEGLCGSNRKKVAAFLSRWPPLLVGPRCHWHSHDSSLKTFGAGNNCREGAFLPFPNPSHPLYLWEGPLLGFQNLLPSGQVGTWKGDSQGEPHTDETTGSLSPTSPPTSSMFTVLFWF